MPVEEKEGFQRDTDEQCSDDDRHMFVNAEDGLRFEALDEENSSHEASRQRIQMQILSGEWEDLDINLEELIDDDFPTNLIVTGFTPEFFDDETLKGHFESFFQVYGEDATFHYFRSFKRVRVTYSSAASAIQARIKMHLSTLGDMVLKCYFGQNPVIRKEKEDGLLHPPTPDKQFLISPPASPPIDWEPIPESHPNVNYDLVYALAKLNPGEAHELHKPEKESHPSIIVHIAGDENEDSDMDGRPRALRIPQTRRPEA